MKLFYRHFGEGQPLIILHGLFGISDNWVSIARRLGEHYEVFVIDQRNHGQSPHSSTFNYFAMVDDLLEFMDDHQIVNPILIGHSMGGKVAMNFALEHPQKVHRLISVDMSVRAYPARLQHMEIIEAMLAVDFEKVHSRGEVELQIAPAIQSERIKMFVMKNLYRINSHRFAWRINIKDIDANLENVFVGVESPYQFEKPSLFIKGELSDYILQEDYKLIKQKFPQAEFTTIKGASHWVHAEKPKELCAVLSKFLEHDCSYT